MAKKQRAYMMCLHTFRGLCHLGWPLSIERLYTRAKYKGKKGLEEGKWRQNVGGERERERKRGKCEERKRWREREGERTRAILWFSIREFDTSKNGWVSPITIVMSLAASDWLASEAALLGGTRRFPRKAASNLCHSLLHR